MVLNIEIVKQNEPPCRVFFYTPKVDYVKGAAWPVEWAQISKDIANELLTRQPETTTNRE
jgi:hypothetical protein